MTDTPETLALMIGPAWNSVAQLDFDAEAISLFVSALRQASERLAFEMKDLIHEHVKATNRVKGEIVPASDSRGNVILLESGRPKNVKLTIRYEIRIDLKPARDGGITFPNLYWAKRKGSAVVVTRGPNPGKKVVPTDRMALPDGQDAYAIGLFRSANPIELQLIQRTEDEAANLRRRARFYSSLWATIRHHRASKHYQAYLASLKAAS